jgi:hypothetical protein
MVIERMSHIKTHYNGMTSGWWRRTRKDSNKLGTGLILLRGGGGGLYMIQIYLVLASYHGSVTIFVEKLAHLYRVYECDCHSLFGEPNYDCSGKETPCRPYNP